MASALDERGRTLDQQQVNSALIGELAPTPDEFVIEVGCGSGFLCRLMAPVVNRGGRITGLDISHEIISIAQDLAVKSDMADIIQWATGRAQALPFKEASFDSALAARICFPVLIPVVVKELIRVVRTGGKVVVMDWDFETVAVDHPNRELTRRVLHWRCDHYGGNNWSGRQLWKHMAEGCFSSLKLLPVVSVARNAAIFSDLSLFRAAQVARDGGGITSSEYDAWVEEIRSALRTDVFLEALSISSFQA